MAKGDLTAGGGGGGNHLEASLLTGLGGDVGLECQLGFSIKAPTGATPQSQGFLTAQPCRAPKVNSPEKQGKLLDLF